MKTPAVTEHQGDGGPIKEGLVTSSIQPLTLQVSAHHQETISFLLTKTQNQAIILEFPWLQQHNPQISWKDR